jgi:SAM-dependent methyltransferase
MTSSVSRSWDWQPIKGLDPFRLSGSLFVYDPRVAAGSHPHALRLDTDLPREELEERLRKWEPWGHLIEFSNGATTADFARRTPFAENPLGKLAMAAESIDFGRLAGGNVLDVGCNSGYNAISLATEYGMRPVGIDIVPRHVHVSRFLAELADVQAEFKIESAETYVREAFFHLVLHFGTLYHLENPILSLRSSRANLRTGGRLALETQVFDADDPNLVYFMHLQNDDPTNFWALSTPVLYRLLERAGFGDIVECRRTRPDWLAHGMSRVLLVATAV